MSFRQRNNTFVKKLTGQKEKKQYSLEVWVVINEEAKQDLGLDVN